MCFAAMKPNRQANRSASIGSPAALLRLSLFAAVVYIAFPCLLQAQQPSHEVVVIKQMHFEPATLSVKAGDTVEWKNQDIFTHTVTANDGSFDSGPIVPGGSWQTTVSRTGNIAYHCGPHPNMMAELVVGQVGEESNHEQGAADGELGHTGLHWAPPKTPDEIHPILVNFTAALLPLWRQLMPKYVIYSIGWVTLDSYSSVQRHAVA
jgi:plastocyanin